GYGEKAVDRHRQPERLRVAGRHFLRRISAGNEETEPVLRASSHIHREMPISRRRHRAGDGVPGEDEDPGGRGGDDARRDLVSDAALCERELAQDGGWLIGRLNGDPRCDDRHENLPHATQTGVQPGPKQSELHASITSSWTKEESSWQGWPGMESPRRNPSACRA